MSYRFLPNYCRILGYMMLSTILAGCSTGSALRETMWVAGGHINTRWSMEDAIDQGLSRKVTGEDWHSHQIYLRRKMHQTFNQQTALMQTWQNEYCLDSQSSADWADLQCRAWIHVKHPPADAPCDFQRCTVVRFSPFVLREDGLLAAIRESVRNPCQVVPDFQALQRKFRTREPRGGITMHAADSSQYWLYCNSMFPVHGQISTTSEPDVFIVHWSRAGLGNQSTEGNR